MSKAKKALAVIVKRMPEGIAIFGILSLVALMVYTPLSLGEGFDLAVEHWKTYLK